MSLFTSNTPVPRIEAKAAARSATAADAAVSRGQRGPRVPRAGGGAAAAAAQPGAPGRGAPAAARARARQGGGEAGANGRVGAATLASRAGGRVPGSRGCLAAMGGMRRAQVHVQRRETDRQREQRTSSYAYLAAREREEPWKPLQARRGRLRPLETLHAQALRMPLTIRICTNAYLLHGCLRPARRALSLTSSQGRDLMLCCWHVGRMPVMRACTRTACSRVRECFENAARLQAWLCGGPRRSSGLAPQSAGQRCRCCRTPSMRAGSSLICRGQSTRACLHVGRAVRTHII